MQHHFGRDAPLLQLPEKRNALIGLDIPVVEAVHDEHGGPDSVRQVQVIPLIPETVVVAGSPVLAAPELRQGSIVSILHRRVIRRILGPAETVFCQKVQVVSLPAQRRNGQTAAAIIVVPVGNPGFRNDGLQPLHAGGSHPDAHGAQVGFRRHRHVPAAPGGFDLDVVRLIGKSTCAPVEPVDYGAKSQDLFPGSAPRKTLGSPGAQAAAKHGGVSSFIKEFIHLRDAFELRLPIDGCMLRKTRRHPLSKRSRCDFRFIGIEIKAHILFPDILFREHLHLAVHIVQNVPVLVAGHQVRIGNVNCRNSLALTPISRKPKIHGDQIFFPVPVGIHRRLHINALCDIWFSLHLLPHYASAASFLVFFKYFIHTITNTMPRTSMAIRNPKNCR